MDLKVKMHLIKATFYYYYYFTNLLSHEDENSASGLNLLL